MSIDHEEIAGRLFALNRFIRLGALARRLGTTIPTLDKLMCWRRARESTYERILPAIVRLEGEVPGIRWRALLEARRQGKDVKRIYLLDQEAARRSGHWPPLLKRSAT